MDAATLRPKLLKRIAILPGKNYAWSRDRDGGPVIIFPAQGEWVEYSYSEVHSVLSYLAQIPEEKIRACGFTVIIDMRNGWIKYLKTILRACQQALQGYIHQVLIIKPEQFLEKQKINLELVIEAYEFRTYVLSIQKLARHVDSTQLPKFLGGSFPYSHDRWIELRNRYESFLRECTGIVRKLRSEKSRDDSVAPNGTLPHQKRDSQAMDEAHISNIMLKGDHLKAELKGGKGEGAQSLDESVQPSNPDFQLSAQRIDILLKQIKDTQKEGVEEEKRRQEMSREKSETQFYVQFLEGVKNVSDWVLGPGEKWILTLHEIGESRDEAEQLRREHETLDHKSQEVIAQSVELKTVADKLIANGHRETSDIKKRKEYLDSITRAFCSRIRWQKDIIKYSCKFHRLLEEVSAKLDEMVESLCSEIHATDANTAEASVKSMDARLETIDKMYNDLIASGQGFIDQLGIREQNTLGYEVTRDYSAGIVHVRQCLNDIHDRKQRCTELGDVRRLKIQQLQQLFTCEKDAEQAIKWIEELYHNLQAQLAKMGSNTEEITLMKHEQLKMEETARSTHDYGKQLCQVSMVLRRSLRMDLGKQQVLLNKLDDVWAKFCRALSERTTSLNIGTAFYGTVREVNDRLEELCAKVSSEAAGAVRASQQDLSSSKPGSPPPKPPVSPIPSEYRSTSGYSAGGGIGGVGRDSRPMTPAGGRGIAQMDKYDHLRKQLGGDVRELRHMAEALISRMKAPIMVYGKQDKDDDRQTETAVRDIRSKMEEVEHKQQYLDECMMEPMNVLVRDLHLDNVHVSLWSKSNSPRSSH